MKEMFKDIQGYEGKYQISNLGRVKSLSKTVKNGVGFAIKKERILTPAKKENDYLFVSLTNCDGKKNCHYVHRLVAIHFIPNPKNKPQVNHKRGNKSDNRFFRLEWATGSENLTHSFKIGTHVPLAGTLSPAAKLNDEKVVEIKTRYKQGGVTIRKLATEFGVHHSVIDGITKGKRWSHVNV